MQGKYVILGILTKGSQTGYEIKEILTEQISFFYDGSYGMIYPTLKKLEQDNLISKEDIIQDGKPNKKVYSITKDGLNYFQNYVYSNKSEEIFKSDFLLKLYFGHSLSTDYLQNIINDEILEKKQNLKKLEQNYKLWKKNSISNTQEIAIKYGIAQYKAVISVLENEINNKKDN